MNEQCARVRFMENNCKSFMEMHFGKQHCASTIHINKIYKYIYICFMFGSGADHSNKESNELTQELFYSTFFAIHIYVCSK